VTRAVPGRRLVVEADGGSRGNPGPAGFGAVVRDPQSGTVLAEVSEAIGVATNNVAEYRGLIAGLRAAVGVDPACTVEVRMDSQLVVEQMSGRWAIRHEGMRRLAEEARSVLPPDRVSYTWVPRERNAHADLLANRAMDAVAESAESAGSSESAEAAESAESAESASSSPRAPAFTRPEPPPGASGLLTTLVLARHGRTEHTDRALLSGAGSDPPLSASGAAEARGLAAAIAGLAGGAPDGAGSTLPGVGPVTRLVSSPLRRARETMAVVAERAGLDAEVVLEEGWREIAFGEWEGLSIAEVVQRWPERSKRWFGATDVGPPGGESLDAFAARVRDQRERTVEANPGEVVLVVSHGGPVAAVVHEALEAQPAALWRVRVDPCSLTVVRYWSDGGIQLVTVNAAGHLASASAGPV
jgi:ribonuclease H / adenosylcobalamin/alpha-ribazole phosphatase